MRSSSPVEYFWSIGISGGKLDAANELIVHIGCIDRIHLTKHLSDPSRLLRVQEGQTCNKFICEVPLTSIIQFTAAPITNF